MRIGDIKYHIQCSFHGKRNGEVGRDNLEMIWNGEQGFN